MRILRIYILLLIALFILSITSCAFIDAVNDELFNGQGLGDQNIKTGMHIMVTPYDSMYPAYPGPSDTVTVKANTFPTIYWDIEGVSQIAEYWIFVYSPLLYFEGLTASILPDVWVIEDIQPNYSALVFGDVPPGAYQWDDPVIQDLKYNGVYIFWVASCDASGAWNGLGMAEVTVVDGIDP